MASLSTPLPPLDNVSKLHLSELPPFRPQFFIPHLIDKPQNPIIESLPFYQKSRKSLASLDLKTLPKELLTLSEQVAEWNVRSSSTDDEDDMEDEDIWTTAYSEPRKAKQALPWLSIVNSNKSTLTPFLSEQPLHVFVSARHYISPRLYDPDEFILFISPEKLVENLKVTLTGCSSSLHIWNAETEKFEIPPKPGTQRTVVIMEGMDEVVTASYVDRFLEIGILLRRLESYVIFLRRQRLIGNPVLHAFTHALSTVLIYVRDMVLQPLPKGLIGTWISIEETYTILCSLATLCHRTIDIEPANYNNMIWPAHQILSHIHDHVYKHFHQSSLKIVRALLAYILTLSSRPYFQEISLSVGYGGVPEFLARKGNNQKMSQSDLNIYEEDNEDEDEDDIDLLVDDDTEDLPSFLHGEPENVLFRTRKSLRILYTASPDHPMFTQSQDYKEIQWCWTRESLVNLLRDQNDIGNDIFSKDAVHPEIDFATISSAEQNYKAELKSLRIFDLEPGTHTFSSKLSEKKSYFYQSLPRFIDCFPESIPTIVPTSSLLSFIVLKPLLVHCQSLNNQTIQVFMAPTSLHLRSHLILLRSYLMLTSHAFKTRLSSALFTDVDEITTGRISIGLRESVRYQPPSPEDIAVNQNFVWAVGLASGLTERHSWPPGGSDLSFYLRTVIVDSLQFLHKNNSNNHRLNVINAPELWEDVESKLGFALRDLPTGSGRNKWLDPNSIEALDFLYLDYKPRRPLSCLISPDVLSKYRRVFAFLLRLLRVENVTRLLFRMTHARQKPLFQTLTKSNTLLFHFVFIAHSFMQMFSSYTYDVAIGGHFDAFLSQVASQEKEQNMSALPVFNDVVSLAKYHSQVLDNILGSCLLRSSQKPIGDALRVCLETVLELGVLIGGLRYGRLKEYDATHLVEILYKKFRNNVVVFTKLLSTSVNKTVGLSDLDPIVVQRSMPTVPTDMDHPVAASVSASLHQLLTRLDFSNWWKHLKEEN